jgi:hypothetical protein
MTKHKAEILLEQEPYEIIRWLTLNYDKEIGAVGIGRIENQKIIIEELCFPEQEVTGTTIHFESGDWGSIIKELTTKYGEKEAIEKIKKINFYWHKHPNGSAKPSNTDEEHTFDAFMDDDAKRRYFAFLQTAKKTWGSDEIEWEPRIEMRYPIRHTIENVSIVTRDLLNVANKCKKIIDTKIKKPVKVKQTHVAPSKNNLSYKCQYMPKTQTKGVNSFTNLTNIAEEEGADYMLQNGAAIIEVADDYVELVESSLKNGTLKSIVEKRKSLHYADSVRYFLQPKKACYQELSKTVSDICKKISQIHTHRAITAMNQKFASLDGDEINDIIDKEDWSAYDSEIEKYKITNNQILAEYESKQQELKRISHNNNPNQAVKNLIDGKKVK